jgi:uncharacterized protein involved in response to NO
MKPVSPALPVLEAAPTGTAAAPAAAGRPLWRLGFRPFYLGAALFGALAVPLWVAVLLGLLPWAGAVPPLLWHGHEMLYGFASAVIVGFLLTAGRAWTGLATPRGTGLAALFGLWLAARVAAAVAPYPVYALIDVTLLPLVAALLTAVLLRAGSHRNLPLAGILLALAAANALFHLSVLGLVDLPPRRLLFSALALIVMIECVIAGRIVPAFTQSATPGLRLTRRPGWEPATLALTALALACWVAGAPAALTGAACGAAAVFHAVRQWGWRPAVTRRRPILWILHAGYAWIPVGLALLALAALGWVAESAAVHALAVGATGGLIIGMITRTARGHTGRALRASRPEVAAYGLVLAAAVLRVALPVVAPQWLTTWLVAAALAWSAAFAIYLVVFTPWLTRARLDGKDG